MTMDQVPSNRSQLDRIESGVKELNERMARIEERQHSQGAKLEAHESHLTDHSQRLREVELRNAVAEATGSHQYRQLSGRWGAVWAVALVAMAAVGGFLSRLIAP